MDEILNIEKNKYKITFDDKADVNELISGDSRYILNADNVNEIKDVVNSLSDLLSGILTFSRFFKYFRLNVPKNLMKECPYSFEIQLSSAGDFENRILGNHIRLYR